MNFAISFDLFHLYHHQDQHHDIARHAFTSAFVRAAREDGSLGTIWWQMRHSQLKL